VRRRRAGIGVGVGLGTGVAVGVGLGIGVAAGVGLGDEVNAGARDDLATGVALTDDACEPWGDVAGGLGVRSTVQPPITKTVSRAPTHNANSRFSSLCISIAIR
jgi:hypothetical protein